MAEGSTSRDGRRMSQDGRRTPRMGPRTGMHVKIVDVVLDLTQYPRFSKFFWIPFSIFKTDSDRVTVFG